MSTTVGKDKRARQSKTAKQRAEEALGLTTRVATRLKERRDALAKELRDVTAEYEAAEARRVYAAKHPDLHTPAPTASTGATS